MPLQHLLRIRASRPISWWSFRIRMTNPPLALIWLRQFSTISGELLLFTPQMVAPEGISLGGNRRRHLGWFGRSRRATRWHLWRSQTYGSWGCGIRQAKILSRHLRIGVTATLWNR